MRYLIPIALLIICHTLCAQTSDLIVAEKDSVAQKPDPLYREDQFYASISYNLIEAKPAGYSQNSFSTGFTIGFLRDIPLNKSRTFAVAAGLGYSYNNIKHNLFVEEVAGTRRYAAVDESTFDKNKFILHYVELPLEFRWRNSGPVSHKFWRVYTGFKISYLFNDRAQLEQGGEKIIVRRNADLNKLMYGAYLAAGWNTWNLYVYYGITPLYKNTAVLDNGQKVGLHSLNLGLMFYIL